MNEIGGAVIIAFVVFCAIGGYACCKVSGSCAQYEEYMQRVNDVYEDDRR